MPLAIGLSFSLPYLGSGMGGGGGVVDDNWILYTGSWRDTGVWIDTDFWNDS